MYEMGGYFTFGLIIAAAVVIFPLWRIFARAGLNPALSLFAFVPFLGWLIVLVILSFSRWPSVERGAQS